MSTKPSKLSLPESMRCGQCLHFKQSAHRNFEAPCSTLGTRSFAIAPKCYTPDYTKVLTNTDAFVQLSALFASKTAEQKKILLSMLRAVPKGKAHKMGTKLFLNLRGREYVSNYVCGYVVGYTSSGELVLTGSPDARVRGRAFFAYLKDDSSLLTTQEWKKRKALLTARGRLVDPTANKLKAITVQLENDTYEVPTIDQAPKDARVAPTKIKRTDDLTKIMAF